MAVGVDLHLHTTCSDGRLTPSELIRLTARQGLKVVSVTDHDSTEGLAEAITELVRSPEKAMTMGRSGRQRIVSLYSWQVHCEKLERVLEQAVRGGVEA